MSHIVDYDPWVALANAIVAQSVEEYRACRAKLQRMAEDLAATPDDEEERKERISDAMDAELDRKYDLIDFFLSDWYAVLCDYDGEKLLERLEREKL